MPVGEFPINELRPVAGVRLAAVAAGIRYRERIDLVLLELVQGSQCAAVFTRNAFCAAPVIIARRHLAQDQPRYLLINSGNANAGTGDTGLADALGSCALVADRAGCRPEQVLPFSTGVIGERLPLERIEAVVAKALDALQADTWMMAAQAIMTTDTRPKGVSRTLLCGGEEIVITGIAKGAGMIRPDMATMLAFLATDAKVERSLLEECLARAVERSFNRISVDGDTSTNDALVLVATGQSAAPEIDESSGFRAQFNEAVAEVCEQLAQMVVRDAEGATKFVTIQIEQGRDAQECLRTAFTIAHSPLVKTALFASDPNWGRILAAVGRAGVEDLDVSRVSLYLGDVCIAREGGRAPEYRERDGQAVMNAEEILIRVVLGRGDATETVWTSDLSHDYVRINAEYRT